MVTQSDITYRLRGIPDHYGKDEVSQLVAELLELDIGAISVRSLASHHFREMEKVATLNLRERPRALENGTNEWKFRYNNLDTVLDTNFIGFTPLHGILDETCDTWYIHLHFCEEHVSFTDHGKVALLFPASTRTLSGHSKSGQTTSCGSETRCHMICQTAESTFTVTIPA